MNILITGGAGFIGSHLADHFSKENTVFILDNFSTGRLENIDQDRCITIKGDIRNKELLDSIMQDIDYVFHEAALISVPLSMKDPSGTIKINTLGTLNVLESAKKAGVKKVIIASSAAVYGNDPVLPKHEGMTPVPESPYAVTKIDCEYLARIFFNYHGLSTAVLRYFNVYGPRQDPNSPYASAIPIFIKKALLGEDIIIYGDGDQTRDFIYVSDIVHANEVMMTRGDGGVFNAASGISITINQVVKIILEITGSQSNVIHTDVREGDVKFSSADITIISQWWKTEVDIQNGLISLVEYMKKIC
ncbi:MAG: NAD-dependent epimerase/dehydratase family protein [Candidatus Methanomarinus sp.]|uniref:NAD-dependent epimerase/dehydratase family protein n=1 Tax=Candidatus Methanomarinus sp. TaxID=3386244 RepID=A0AC61SDD6_9EURY|nr:UDP-glucose 4-epimerase [ANME-2 cluster archaeon]PPA79217.1 MAG: UDP-galactose-4-epimerase [ANME-2 cluster archaeon HR1]TKY92409.1 MAG: NAD-dependent epimerase/dehydratase family protein [ANME-2 cluster archaeon]